MKTMAIKLEDDLHAQLVMIAQLDGVALVDEIRQALELLIERKRSQGDLAQRAESVLEEIDREAVARRAAIQALFSPQEAAAEPEAKEPKGRRGRSSGPQAAIGRCFPGYL